MEPEQQQPSQETSKKAAKKEAAKAEKLRRKQEAAAASAAASGVAGVSIDGPDPLAANYGDIPIKDLQSKEISGRVWTTISSLTDELKNQTVLIRGRAQTIRAVGKKMAFLTVREKGYTVQCVLTVAPDHVSAQMVKYATAISKESFVDIEGAVTVPPEAIKGASQQVEIQVRKIHCVNRAAPVLPINVEDAARSDVEIEKALEAGEQLVRVNQDTRLNYRILDMRTPANQGIFRLECQVLNLFRQFLLNEDFIEIQTPKLIAGSSEGGAAVFKLEYKKQPACLAQSPQLHKQMAICGDFGRVFLVGPVFRAEDSYTHRHLCEFVGLDVEMEIKEHYSEVMDIVDRLFVEMFDKLNERCKKELEAIGKQYPFQPLKYLRNTLRLTFEEGVQMLKDAGVEVDPLGDLNTESERILGKLVLEKYLKILNFNLLFFIYKYINLLFNLRFYLLILGMGLSFIYYTATLWQFDRFILCLVLTTKPIATHLMFSLEVRRSFLELNVCMYLNFWSHVQKNVGLMSKQYQHILILSGMGHRYMVGLESD
ncbi:hypothetical protein R6Q59_027988 [Mikania micrantha]